jgi:hypothetical protein
MLNETTMAIYGGYSQGFEDYCDDLWMFDLVALKWSKQETAEGPGEKLGGYFSRLNFRAPNDKSSLFSFYKVLYSSRSECRHDVAMDSLTT